MASKVTSGGAAAIIAAVLLPPLGLYLVHGLTPVFWIGVILTCLGIVPGIAYALFMVLTADRRTRPAPSRA